MKVLYFHQHFSTPKGSTGIRSYQMAQKLISNGHEVTMVCGSYKGGETGLTGEFKRGKREGLVDNVKVIEFNLGYSNKDGFLKRSITFLKFAFKSILVAISSKYDVVFATSTPLTAGIPGIVARWLRWKPFVFEVRDLWPELPKQMGVIKNPLILAMMSMLEWTTYHSAHALIGLSPGIVEGIAKRGVKSEKISMIPNGCDLSIFDQDKVSWRPKEVGKNDFMAVFTGTHGVANGLSTVLDTALILKKSSREDIKILLVGQGKLKEELISRAKAENLTNVIFHDPVDKEKLGGLMLSADVGLQILANIPAFYYGTSPNKFFDYISASLPVVNNYPGWLADLITENKCGMVVKPDNPQDFADSLIKLADNKSKLKQMGIAARSLAEDRFDRDDLSDDFVKQLESVL